MYRKIGRYKRVLKKATTVAVGEWHYLPPPAGYEWQFVVLTGAHNDVAGADCLWCLYFPKAQEDTRVLFRSQNVGQNVIMAFAYHDTLTAQYGLMFPDKFVSDSYCYPAFYTASAIGSVVTIEGIVLERPEFFEHRVFEAMGYNLALPERV